MRTPTCTSTLRATRTRKRPRISTPTILNRSGARRWEAFGIGLVHGVGGSAGAGVLLVASAPTAAVRIVALVVFAAGTALSIGVVSALVGQDLATGALARRLERFIQAIGVASGLFGLWYAAGAL